MKKCRWFYDIYLKENNCRVKDQGNYAFATHQEAYTNAKNYILNVLTKTYGKNEEDFKIDCYNAICK